MASIPKHILQISMWKRLSRSELLSTFFPTWVWQGREWSKWRIPKYDPHYWIVAYAHPVLSSFYPFSVLSGFISNFMGIDTSFDWLVCTMLGHILFAFIGWYKFTGLFGAITFTFAAYNWKQQPCTQYTLAWFPWLLLGVSTNNWWLSSLSFGMILLAGYYPIGIQCVAIAVLASLLWHTNLLWVPIGIVIGLPQLIPFLRYLPKTIRANKVSNIGKVPWYHPLSLIIPKLFRHNLNGVGFWEMAYYVGIVPIIIMASSANMLISRAWMLAVVSYFLMIGVGSKWLPRIPARWCFTFQFSIIWMSISCLSNMHFSNRILVLLCLIQAFDLWLNNSSLLINHPYTELYNKPSWAFNTRLTRYLKENLHADERVSGLPYPLFTGHINSFRTLGYSGGMQLKLMAKWRNDNNPDGSGGHDYFRSNTDDRKLDIARCKFAWTTKKLNWLSTGIPHLWRNPRIS